MKRGPWFVLILVSIGCQGEAGSTNSGFQVDTLEGGTKWVRNGTEGRWTRTAQDAWTLREDLSIGRLDGDGPDLFGLVRNVIPGIDGTIWVLDSQAQELRQFASDGGFLRTLGGPGEGPGEFGRNTCAFAGPHGEIWVESGGRWQRFNANGELLGGQPVTRSLACGILTWRGEELAAAFSEYDPATQELSGALILHERSPDGTVTTRDTLPMPTIPDRPTVEWFIDGRRVRSARLPLAHSPGYFLQDSGVFWVTDGSGDYRFRRQALEGDTLLIVERSHEPVSAPDSIRNAEIEGLYWNDVGYPDGFRESDVPRDFPPFERIVEATDGTVWMRRRVQGGQVSYDVFRATGEFLGAVPLPSGLREFREHSITDSYVYGVARGELDVQYVVRLRIRK
jgi:hypothetical protein